MSYALCLCSLGLIAICSVSTTAHNHNVSEYFSPTMLFRLSRPFTWVILCMTFWYMQFCVLVLYSSFPCISMFLTNTASYSTDSCALSHDVRYDKDCFASAVVFKPMYNGLLAFRGEALICSICKSMWNNYFHQYYSGDIIVR